MVRLPIDSFGFGPTSAVGISTQYQQNHSSSSSSTQHQIVIVASQGARAPTSEENAEIQSEGRRNMCNDDFERMPKRLHVRRVLVHYVYTMYLCMLLLYEERT